jgi:hypothetical protein
MQLPLLMVDVDRLHNFANMNLVRKVLVGSSNLLDNSIRPLYLVAHDPTILQWVPSISLLLPAISKFVDMILYRHNFFADCLNMFCAETTKHASWWLPLTHVSDV